MWVRTRKRGKSRPPATQTTPPISRRASAPDKHPKRCSTQKAPCRRRMHAALFLYACSSLGKYIVSVHWDSRLSTPLRIHARNEVMQRRRRSRSPGVPRRRTNTQKDAQHKKSWQTTCPCRLCRRRMHAALFLYACSSLGKYIVSVHWDSRLSSPLRIHARRPPTFYWTMI